MTNVHLYMSLVMLLYLITISIEFISVISLSLLKLCRF